MRDLRRGPAIGRLLLGVNLFVLLVPVVAVVLLRIYEQHLVHQTESRLIAEAALIGEAWRGHLLAASGQPDTADGHIQPPDAPDARFFPFEPVIDLYAPAAATEGQPTRTKTPDGTAPWRAGQALKPLLDRAKLVNLSGARVLDAEGCVVASTADGLGACLDYLPEVRAALAGRYHAVARPRDPPERKEAKALSRSGEFRVFVALPLFSDGRVIGVVRMSRTTLDIPQALWPYRQVLLWASVACLVLTALLSLFLSRTLVRPVRALTAAAEAIARGERGPTPQGRVPAEVFQLHAALTTMAARLHARATDVADFAANVSHELKTPLTSVRGAVELLRDDWSGMDEDQRGRFLANIDDDAARMQRLVTRLLELARIEHAPPESREISPGSFLTELLARYEDVHLDLTQAPPTTHLPPEHLATAVTNLVDNALHHGGAPVLVSVASEGDRLRISVSDYGPGISERNQARIFDRFFTTERDRGGTGLGLAIVQAIARARGGRIECERTGPDGTTFLLVL